MRFHSNYKSSVILVVDVFGFFVSPSPGEHYRLAGPPDLYRSYGISANTLGSSGVLRLLDISRGTLIMLPVNF